MNCCQCKTEFSPPKNHPLKRFCTRLCQQKNANENRKLARRKAWGVEGMDSSTFRVFTRSGRYERPLKDKPQRKRKRLNVPPIPKELGFLYGIKRPKYESQEEMRANAVKAMVNDL